jgi:hypothetical protein
MIQRIKFIFKFYGWEIFLGIVGLVAINSFLLFPPYRGNTFSIDPELAAKFGDFIGGYIGTFFLWISILLLFSTLRHQYRTFNIQNFETKFFLLIQIHVQNVNNLQLPETEGRRVFQSLWREFQKIYKIIKVEQKNHFSEINDKLVLKSAFQGFYYGMIGDHSPNMLRKAVSEETHFFIEHLLNACKDKRDSVKSSAKIAYIPFEGHQARLNHYFRHLFETSKFIENNAKKSNIRTYVDILRAELSIHEQCFLALWGIVPEGKEWQQSDYIQRYDLIRDIPDGMIDEVNLSEIYPKVSFKWETKRDNIHN